MDDLTVDHLIHFTSGPKVIASICENGFLLIPNRRELIRDFLSDDFFRDREPQDFGMVCFTDLAMHQIAEHAAMYGQYGICVSNKWATDRAIDRVLYVRPYGPVFDVFRWLFQTAKIDLDNKIKYPDDGAWTDSYFNATVAQVIAGAHIYGLLLHLYEFMQPIKDYAESEWRIVQKDPVTFRAKSRQEMIEEALRVAKTWRTHSIDISPRDIRFFVCRSGQEATLAAALPPAFRKLSIQTYPRRQWLVSKLFRSISRLRPPASIDATRAAALRRFPAHILRRSSAPRSMVNELPRVAHVEGVSLEGLQTPQQSRITIQYTDLEEKRHQLDLPFLEVMRFLLQIQEDTGFARWRRTDGDKKDQ